MKKLTILLLILLNLSAFAQQGVKNSSPKKAIIVLTYDDALLSQLDIAIPQLDSVQLTGTFFLTGNITQQTMPRWEAAGSRGHELANHTLYHPCLLSNVKGNPANNSAIYTVYTIIREIGMMNTLLYAMDNKKTHTYAYPCTETMVGGVSYVDSLRRTGLVKYARIGGDQNDIITDYQNLDPLQVPSFAVVGDFTGNDLIGFVKKVQLKGGMGVFMFHGVGGDYLTTSAKAHRELLSYLSKHKAEILVTTFQKAMSEIKEVK